MFEAITKQLIILMENEYVCKVYHDDRDVIVIQFENDQKSQRLGLPELHWLTAEEVDVVNDYRLNKETIQND
jgi:hypothetical protein